MSKEIIHSNYLRECECLEKRIFTLTQFTVKNSAQCCQYIKIAFSCLFVYEKHFPGKYGTVRFLHLEHMQETRKTV